MRLQNLRNPVPNVPAFPPFVVLVTLLAAWAVVFASPANAGGEKRQLAALEAENLELRRALVARIDEAAHYRRGLERAVDELNRLRRAGIGRPVEAVPAREVPAPESTILIGDRLLSVARVRVQNGRATVTGEIRNTHPRHLRGVLTIELLREGHRVGIVELPFEAPSAYATPYAHTFELEGYAAGEYAARVDFEY